MVFRPLFYSLPLLCVVRWFSGKNRSLEKRSGFEFTGVMNWLWAACARDFLLSEAQVPHPHLLNGYNYWSRSNSVLPKIHVDLEPQNVALFGNRVFANIVSQDEVVLDPMTGVLMRGKDTQSHTQRRTPCEDTDRNWNDSSTSQEAPRTVGGHQKQGERHEMDSPPQSPGRTNPAIPDFQYLASWIGRKYISIGLRH